VQVGVRLSPFLEYTPNRALRRPVLGRCELAGCAPLRTAGHPLPRLAYVVVPTHTRRPHYMFVSTLRVSRARTTVEIRDSSDAI
jgi:hypothetical protein